jgi:cell division protease FtsH
VTIVPRGRAAGITWFLPDERDFRYKDQLMSELSVAFGGRAAEEVVFSRISTGAANDIKKATELAQMMVRSWGMSENLGPLSYAKNDEQIFLGREIQQHRDYSDETAKMIDQEISRIVTTSYENARRVVEDNLDILHNLADMLLERETVKGDELDALIQEMRPGFKIPGGSRQEHEDFGEDTAEAAGAQQASHADDGEPGNGETGDTGKTSEK